MSTLPFGFQFERTRRAPLDVSYVFNNVSAFQTYLTSGPAYAGQVVAVLNGDDPPDVFVINREGATAPFRYTYSSIVGSSGEGLRRGESGTYVRGQHFDIPGTDLQEFLDAKINNRYFTGPVVIENGSSARPGSPPILISNVFMPGQTLYLRSYSQFGDKITVSGLVGSLNIDGAWGNNDFAASLSFQHVSGAVILSGQVSPIRFNDVSFFNCADVRLAAGWDAELRINGTLIISQSNLAIQGQGNARHNYNRTNFNPGSRIDIADTLALDAVQLDMGATEGPKNGWIIDRRLPNHPLETFLRRGAGGDGDAISLWGRPIANIAPLVGQVLMWNGSVWIPTTVALRPQGPYWDSGVYWDSGLYWDSGSAGSWDTGATWDGGLIWANGGGWDDGATWDSGGLYWRNGGGWDAAAMWDSGGVHWSQ